jgi:hypothetical protein
MAGEAATVVGGIRGLALERDETLPCGVERARQGCLGFLAVRVDLGKAHVG